MLEASFELIVPLVVAAMIDKGIYDSSYLFKGFFCLIGLGFIGLICSCTAQFFAAKAATGFATGLRHDLFKHLLNLSYSRIDTIGTSTMITRMTSDVNTVQSGVNMFLRLFLRSPFIVLGAMIMAFFIDVQTALIFLVVIVVLGIVVFIIMKTNIPMLKKVQGKLDAVLNLTRENLSGVRVVRAFVREEIEINNFEEKNKDLSNLQIKAGKISGLLNPLTYVIINLAIVALVYSGAQQIDEGILTKGQVIALYNYMSQILLELIKFAGLIVTINKALASANRISEVFDIPANEDINDTEDEKLRIDNIDSIEFKNVSLKYYADADESLTDISFIANKNSTIGIIGGTGSGKSSLINLIPKFYDPTKGQILINGIDIKEYDVENLRSNIGIVMQKAVLFAGSIKDNLLWGNENASEEDLLYAVKMACAKDVVDSKGGLDALVEANGKNLSGGQRQRLTIARALVRKPKVLILDDASSALDFVTDLQLRTNIKALEDKPIVFIVSQRTSAVKDADLIIVLDDGDMVGIGSHEELLKTCDVYREIHYSQSSKEVQ